MFKATSDNKQFHSRNAVMNGRGNGNGIDETAFDKDGVGAERAELAARKKKLEAAASDLKLRIGDASARAKGFRSGSRVDDRVYQTWSANRRSILAEISRIEARLFEIKKQRVLEHRDQDREKEKRFERVFMRMAKELLAGPVYDRVVTAAIHRLQDECEGGEK